MSVFKEVRKLELPPGEYIVLGSGILGALGIREIGDVDLLVSPQLFDELRAKGWAYDEVEIEGRTREHLANGNIEAYRDFWYGGHNPNPAELIANPQVIDGVPFLPLTRLLEIKKVMGREKDIRDVVLIEKYLVKSI